MVERKKIAGIGEDTGAGAWGIGEEGRGQGSQMVERKKIAGIGGKTGAAQRGGLGKRGGGGGEPVVILFKSPFRYTSSWYTLWLVSFRRMPIKWNGDMFQLWARRVVIQKRMSASYIDVYERDGKLITAFPAHQLPQQEQKDTSEIVSIGWRCVQSPPLWSDRVIRTETVRWCLHSLWAFCFWLQRIKYGISGVLEYQLWR